MLVAHNAIATTEDGGEVEMVNFKPTGRQLPDMTGERVPRVAPASCFHPKVIMGSECASLSVDDAMELRGPGLAWATEDQLLGLQSLEAELVLPDSTVCHFCHHGWSDEKTGPLLLCKGMCNRAFHPECHDDFPVETQTCGR